MNTFQQTFHVPGTLTAGLAIMAKAFTPAILVHVSAVASNATAATLKIGTTETDQSAKFMAEKAIGKSNVPAEFDFDDFVQKAEDTHPRINKGDVILYTLDHDGAAGTAAQNVTIVATFLPG